MSARRDIRRGRCRVRGGVVRRGAQDPSTPRPAVAQLPLGRGDRPQARVVQLWRWRYRPAGPGAVRSQNANRFQLTQTRRTDTWWNESSQARQPFRRWRRQRRRSSQRRRPRRLIPVQVSRRSALALFATAVGGAAFGVSSCRSAPSTDRSGVTGERTHHPRRPGRTATCSEQDRDLVGTEDRRRRLPDRLRPGLVERLHQRRAQVRPAAEHVHHPPAHRSHGRLRQLLFLRRLYGFQR